MKFMRFIKRIWKKNSVAVNKRCAIAHFQHSIFYRLAFIRTVVEISAFCFRPATLRHANLLCANIY